MVHLKDALATRPSLCLAVCGPVKWTFSKEKKWTTMYNNPNNSTGILGIGDQIDHTGATSNGQLFIKYEV
jgi:hypothetical protein